MTVLLVILLTSMVQANITLTQVAAVETPDWLAGKQARIPSGLTIVEHTEKHKAAQLNAWKMYSMLLEGQCAASTRFCGGSDIEFLYICLDPVTGVIAGLLQFGDEIRSAFGYDDSNYWQERIRKGRWTECNDYD